MLKENDINTKKTYNIVNIESFFRYIGIVLIIIFLGYIAYKTIRRNKNL